MHNDEIEVELEFEGIPTYCLVEYEYDGFPSEATIIAVHPLMRDLDGEITDQWDTHIDLKDHLTGKQESYLSELFAAHNREHEDQAWAYEAECERRHGR